MKSTQHSLVHMFETVVAHFQQHLKLVASSPALFTALNNFRARVANINSTLELELQAIGAESSDKKRLKELLCELFARNASLMHAYAINLDNNELMEEVKYSARQLFTQEDNELVTVCRQLVKHAQDNQSSLKEYGIDQATVTLMQASLENYQSAESEIAPSVKQHKSSYRDSNIQTKNARKFLKTEVDKLMLKFRNTEPAFFNGYFIAREEDDPKTAATRVIGTVTDKTTRQGIAGTRVEGIQDDKIVFTVTDNKGRYTLKVPQGGSWKLKFFHVDYVECGIIKVEMILGKRKVVDLEMDKKS